MFAERIWSEKKKKQTPTDMELEKGGVGEGGAVELWERRTDGAYVLD